MFLDDTAISADILTSVTSEIILILKQKYFMKSLFIKYEFCGNAIYNKLFFTYLLNYAVWGARGYNAEGCELLCFIGDIKKPNNSPVALMLSTTPKSEDIEIYKKNIKNFIKASNLDAIAKGKPDSVQLDSLCGMKEIYKRCKFETFTVAINKISGERYGLINPEAPKVYKAGKQLVPIFINEKFKVIWGNDLYEYMLTKGAAMIDCVLVDDTILQELQQAWLCMTITSMTEKSLDELVGKFSYDLVLDKQLHDVFEDEDTFFNNFFRKLNVACKYRVLANPDKRIADDFIVYLKTGKKSELLTIVDKLGDYNHSKISDILVINAALLGY